MAKLFALLAIVCTLTLAGCSGKGDGDSGPSTSSTSTSTGPLGNGTGNGTDVPEPIVLTGTVSGVEDCTLAAQGRAPVSPSNVVIPAEASNRTYTLTFAGGQFSPVGFTGCIGFAGGPLTGGLTGTVPDGATAAQVGVNLGQGRTYTLTIV